MSKKDLNFFIGLAQGLLTSFAFRFEADQSGRRGGNLTVRGVSLDGLRSVSDFRTEVKLHQVNLIERSSKQTRMSFCRN
jgi:hypothetical protein